MKTLVIHIGCHKTGTTSLQNYLHENSETLKSDGIHYLAAGRGKRISSHKPMAIDLQQSGKQHDRGPWRAAADEIKASETSEIFVMSAEGFCLVEPDILHGALRDVADTGTAIKVVCYVRPHAAAIASLFSQTAKFGRQTPISDYIKITARNNLFRYHTQYTQWSAIFGEENVSWRPYIKSRLTGGDVIEDYLAELGYDVENKPFKPASDNSNVSPGHGALAQIAQIWRFAKAAKGRKDEFEPDFRIRLGEYLISEISSLHANDQKFRLPADDYASVVELYHEDASLLDKQVFGEPIFEKALLEYEPGLDTFTMDPRDILGDKTGEQALRYAKIIGEVIELSERSGK